MSNELEIGHFLELSARLPVIDVRSPGEYVRGHIPGAVNIPLFSNEERARVGMLYKQRGRNEAVMTGLDIVGPRMSSYVQQVRKLAAGNEVLVHCWRGGMRSGSFSWLLNTSGIKASTLKRGYKAYRNHVLACFQPPVKIIVLGGETGSGKTEILRYIKEAGEQVIDLEGLAHHKGSSFGAIGQETQPTPEQFENNLALEWSKIDPHRRLWLEDESKSIGRVFINDTLWLKMKHAPIVRVKVPKQERIVRLVREYGKAGKHELEAAIMRIEKRLGGLAFKQSLEALEKDDLAVVADLTLSYYDKAYDYNHEKRKYKDVHFVEVENADPQLNAQKVIAFANDMLRGLDFV